jgi:cysteine synthase
MVIARPPKLATCEPATGDMGIIAVASCRLDPKEAKTVMAAFKMDRCPTNPIRLSDLLGRTRFAECLSGLVQPLPTLSREVGNEVWAFLGKLLPGGSTKFISVVGMLNDLYKRGALDRCQNLVVSSSGNTAIAAALSLYGTGVKLHAVVDPRTAPGKLDELSRWGALIVMVEQPDEKRGWLGARLRRTEELVCDLPNAVDLDQYGNGGALVAHYEFTGNFLWRALECDIDVAVASVGTGGTAGGTFYRLRELNPTIKTVAVDCEGSAVLGGLPTAHLLTGIGAQFACTNVLRTYASMAGLPPQVIGDAEAFREAHWLLNHEGISVGGSSGATIAAIRHISRELTGQRVVLILPDGGESYQQTIFNTSWLSGHGIIITTKEEPVCPCL